MFWISRIFFKTLNFRILELRISKSDNKNTIFFYVFFFLNKENV